MVANSFPRKQVPTKNLNQKFFVENFYCCKVVSSKTGSYQKFKKNIFGEKFFIDAKSFPRKQDVKKISQKFYVENWLWLQTHFLENMLLPKI